MCSRPKPPPLRRKRSDAGLRIAAQLFTVCSLWRQSRTAAVCAGKRSETGNALKTVLLVQARDPRDRMIPHEFECIRFKLGADRIQLVARNAFMQVAQPQWLDGVDGVVLGGSGDFSVNHPSSHRWVTPVRDLIDAALQRDVPGFGICFGHQLLGRHFGGDVVTDPRHEEVGTVELHVTDAGRDDPLFAGFPREFAAHTGHSDHVTGAPSGLRCIVGGGRSPNQGFAVVGARFWSTQFHPDLTGAEARARYLTNKRGSDGSVAPHYVRAASAFAVDRDESTALLHRFAELVSPREASPQPLSKTPVSPQED